MVTTSNFYACLGARARACPCHGISQKNCTRALVHAAKKQGALLLVAVVEFIANFIDDLVLESPNRPTIAATVTRRRRRPRHMARRKKTDRPPPPLSCKGVGQERDILRRVHCFPPRKVTRAQNLAVLVVVATQKKKKTNHPTITYHNYHTTTALLLPFIIIDLPSRHPMI